MSLVYYLTIAAIAILGFYAEARGNTTGTLVMLENEQSRRRPGKGGALMVAIVLIAVAGLRYGVGSDFGAYYKLYDGSLSKFFDALIHFNEPGIRFVAVISRLFYDDGAAVIFGASLLTIGLYVLQIYKHSPMFAISIILFVLMGDWHGSFNGVRQYLAAAVLFAGHRFILERKFIKYVIVVFIASLFHTSAIIMIVPYFILTHKLNFWQLLVMAAGAVAIRFSYDFLFNAIGYYKGHDITMDSYVTSSVNILRIAVSFVPPVVYLLFCEKEGHTREQDFYLSGMTLYAFTMVATMGSTYLARAGIYLSFFQITGYGYLFGLIKEQRLRTVLILAALVCFFIFWRYEIGISSDLRDFEWIFDR